MNQMMLNAFSPIKPKFNVNIDHHLWVILQKLSEIKQSESVYVPLSKSEVLTISFAPDGERARKVVRRSNYRMTGKQPSSKCKRMVQWESHYEKKAFQLLEVSPYVKTYREQPALFEYQDANGVMKIHYPDIFVKLINGIKLFIEVKPQRAKDNEDLLSRESLLKKLLSQKGFKYLQIYPEQIESFNYQKNAQHMLWHTKSLPLYPVKEKISNFLYREQQTSLENLIEYLNDLNARSWIFSLLADGLIYCDLSMPLIGSTLLSIKRGK